MKSNQNLYLDPEKSLSLLGSKPAQLPSSARVLAQRKPRRFIIVRHGSTDLNAPVGGDETSVDRIRGWSNIPLNNNGVNEARRTGQAMQGLGVKAMFNSDLSRAHETAEIVGTLIGVVSSPTMKLRPWDLGDFTGTPSKECIEEIAQYTRTPDLPVPGGESFNEFRHRAFDGLQEALEESEGQLVAIVTHHRNERLYKAWVAKGWPVTREIDIPTFINVGEPPGSYEELTVDQEALSNALVDER